MKKGRITKPVVAWCVGTCASCFTTEVLQPLTAPERRISCLLLVCRCSSDTLVRRRVGSLLSKSGHETTLAPQARGDMETAAAKNKAFAKIKDACKWLACILD